jgi:DNA helicase II / ATP-dependent DNA helicase PcrA
MNLQAEFERRYAMLNPEQKQAVDTIDGPVMVVAGPGMGKTELLGLRVANILKETDTAPEAILCLTFTESAALNMQNRLVELIGADAFKVAIHTFHSFATEVINHNPEYFYDGVKFAPADPLAQIKILSDIMDNLHIESPLAIKNKEFKYKDIRAVQSAIGSIKGEGFLPTEYLQILSENEELLNQMNPLFNVYFDKNTRKNEDKLKLVQELPLLIEAIELIQSSTSESTFANRGIKKITAIYLEKLKDLQVIMDKQDKLSVTPISEFKKRFFENTNDKKYILKDLKHLPKNRELAVVYAAYRDALHKQGLFDFADMLIEVNRALKTELELSYKYKEKYLYMLVDEFQDTNLSQSTMLDSLVDMEYSEGMPNVMVVGDDDQAIYKFQGANIENILSFQEKYPTTTFITLHRNYRSHQMILDLAKSIIENCEVRLSGKLDINKELLAGLKTEGCLPEMKKSRTRLQQISQLALSVKEQIDAGVPPTEIAVLVKKHKQLNDVLKIFEYHNIPVRYEYATNVLNQKYIREIINIMKYVHSVLAYDEKTKDEYAHTILGYEMFGLAPLSLYKISQIAYRERISWLDALSTYGNSEAVDALHVLKIHGFLVELARDAQVLNVEQVMDKILGITKEGVIMEDEHDDGAGYDEVNPNKSTEPAFALRDVVKEKPEYLVFLSGLKVFVDSLRSYKSSEVIFVQDVVEYVELLEENEISLNDNSPYNQTKEAVQLMTVYKSKGLEFEVVYVLDCINETWNSKLSNIGITLARNTPFAPEPDNADDFLRIFFVALTRAKSKLFLFTYCISEENKEIKQLEFLVSTHDQISTLEVLDETPYEMAGQLEAWLHGDIEQRTLALDEKEWLRPFFETYKLSVTNLNNYLDVVSGGPARFLERNILRFPESKNPSASYGTAIHEALARGYIEFTKTGVIPSLDFIIGIFDEKLDTERLSSKDVSNMRYKGHKCLPLFYKEKFITYGEGMKVEVNFKSQGVRVREVPLSGAIDQMLFDKQNKLIHVVDLKTGKGSTKWNGGSGANEYMKKKLDAYRRQLVFYKLLVENSRDFRDYRVESGSLLFVEPHTETGEIIDLRHEISEAETIQLANLIEIVYGKILNFDFPDTSKMYPETAKGTQMFIDDLLSGRV